MPTQTQTAKSKTTTKGARTNGAKKVQSITEADAPAPEANPAAQTEGWNDPAGPDGAATPVTPATPDAPAPLAQTFLRVIGSGTIDPRELEIDETANIRRFKHLPDSIQERAADMLANGQVQPIMVTRTPAGKLKVELGYLRSLAGVMINENGLTPEPWLIRYEEVDPTDLMTHLCRAAVENISRKAMNDVDLLHLFKRLKAEGLDQRRIADRLKLNEGTVSRVFSLEKLDARELRMVAAGTLPSEHAREMAGMPKETRKPLVDKIASGEKVTVSEIKQVAAQARREAKAEAEANGETDTPRKPGGVKSTAVALSAKQMAYPFELTATNPKEGEEADAVEKWCQGFIEYRMGNGNGRKLIRGLYKLAGLEVPTWVRQIPE